jgi:hypothetical protein
MIKKLTLLMLWVAYGLTKAIAQDLAPITPTTISPNFTWYKKITGVDTSFYGYSNNNWVNFARREWVKKNIKDSLASYSKNVNVIHNFGNEDKHGNLRFYTGSDSPFGEVLMFDVGGLTTNGHVLTPTFYYGLNARINNDNTYIGQGSIAFGKYCQSISLHYRLRRWWYEFIYPGRFVHFYSRWAKCPDACELYSPRFLFKYGLSCYKS